MRPTLSSLTALLVAGARAVPRDVAHPAADSLAMRMLPRPLAAVLQKLVEYSHHDRTLVRLLPTLSMGLVDHISLRTLAIDAECVTAVAAGAKQLVVLGAGFDTRAHRLECLHDVDVFEVDHPATSAVKAARAAGLPLCAKSLRRVRMNFEHDDLSEALAGAGHDARMPTLWVWEGVTMYLSGAAIDQTLEVLEKRSAPASTLAMSYGPPDFAPPVYLAFLRVAHEPLRSLLTAAEVAEKLSRFGFVVGTDQGLPDWLVRFGGGAWIVGRERLVVGKRQD